MMGQKSGSGLLTLKSSSSLPHSPLLSVLQGKQTNTGVFLNLKSYFYCIFVLFWQLNNKADIYLNNCIAHIANHYVTSLI